MSEAAGEFPRKAPHKKRPMAIPYKQWKREQAIKKALPKATVIGAAVLGAGTGIASSVLSPKTSEPAPINQQEEARHHLTTSNVEVAKKVYTDLLTNNPQEQENARKLIDGERFEVMKIAAEIPIIPRRALATVKEFRQAITNEATNNKIPLPVSMALALIENKGAQSTSSEGAVGIYQLSEDAAKDMELTITRNDKGEIVLDERRDPQKNIEGGNKYLAKQRDRFGGNLGIGLLAYYSGPQTIVKLLNIYSEDLSGHEIIGPEDSIDDLLVRQKVKRLITDNNISVFSLLHHQKTSSFIGKNSTNFPAIREFVPRAVAATEYLIAERIVEPETITVNIPIPQPSYPAKRTDGAVV